jgi:hypothetical protein
MTSAQLKNSFSFIGEIDGSMLPSTMELKFCAGLQSIRYFVLSKTHRQVLFFGSYTLHHIGSESELTERIARIYEKDEILQLKFDSVQIAFDVPYALVPQEFSAFVKESGQVIQSFQNGFDLLYYNSKELERSLLSHFPRAEFKHINTSLVHFLPGELLENTDKLFVNVSSEYADVVRFDAGKQLQLMNRYGYKDAKDFIYFVALCCEDLKINREETELVLLGEVDIQSKIYDLCYRYFRNISFVGKPADLSFAKAFDLYPKHLHFNLYNL